MGAGMGFFSAPNTSQIMGCGAGSASRIRRGNARNGP